MAGAILSHLLQTLIDSASSWAIQELRRAWGVDMDSEFQNLKSKLSTIQAVLEDAEERQFESRVIRDWLQKLKEVAYDADDVVDEIDTEARQSNSAESGSEGSKKRKRVWDYFSSFLSSSSSQRVLANRIREMNARLDEIAEEKRDLHLEIRQESMRLEIKREERRLFSSVRDESSQILGRTEDAEQIMKILMSDDDSSNAKFSVIGIVGMGGVGKTTLAQVVYNEKTITERFEVKAWVCVSEHFDVERLTKEIIAGAGRSTCDLSGLDNSQCCLRDIVKGRKYLVVLDDVWSENNSDWEQLQVPLTFGARGSRIVVTTRSLAVLNAMQATWTHKLEGLSQNDCRSLFLSRAFKNEESSEAYPKLLEIGEELVKKCGGLPLAAKAVGGLLTCTRQEREWESVLKSRIWNLKGSAANIIPALRLSYQHLPAHLKRCFTFCSVFPKDYGFEKENLVHIWIAHGFIRPEEGKEIEEIGSEYFNDLLLRSFFQCEFHRYKMHDLVHDLAQFIAGYECFQEEHGKSHDDPSKIRHLSCTVATVVDKDWLINLEPFYESTVRTLCVFNRTGAAALKLPQESFEKLRFIRVLDLSWTNIRELPNSIGNLKLLRYLNLSYTYIKELPESICSIYSMKTLLLRGCSNLIELPNEMRKLIRLRQLDLDYCRSIISMPPEIGRLVCLQKLPLFVVGRERGKGIAELKELREIRGKLRIEKLENVADSEDVRQANLKNKPFIDDLELEWSGNHIHCSENGVEEEIANGLQPHPDLKSLYFKGYRGAHFPSWTMKVHVLMLLSNLHTLTLFNCRKCSILPPLGYLPSLSLLQIAEMDGLKQMGHEVHGVACGGRFPSLKQLHIGNMVNLEHWHESEEGEFPCLEVLLISNCPKLRQMTSTPLTNLKELCIARCGGIEALPLLPSLYMLHLSGDISEGVLNSMACVTSLSSLTISGMANRTSLTWRMLQPLTKLKHLEIKSCPRLMTLLEEENAGLQDERHNLPSTLTSVCFSRCPNLQSLPRGLHALTCLQTLRVESCPSVTSVPEEGLPLGLQTLQIRDCPELESCLKYAVAQDF